MDSFHMIARIMKIMHLVLLVLVLIYVDESHADFHVSKQNLELLVGETQTFRLTSDPLDTALNVSFVINHADLLEVIPENLVVPEAGIEQDISVKALDPGHAEITLLLDQNVTGSENAFVRVTIQHSDVIYHVSFVIGWIYFAAWSVSFYPQIYSNWKRKSVVGLNFDFLVLNIIGFTLYSLFNCGMYWIPEIQQDYFAIYPRGMLPVLVNDIVFGLHAMLATAITIIQCSLYERGEQRVSTTARIIVSVFALILLVSMILSFTQTLTWLDFLYFCSYIKLSITLIKYVPQAYMNYKRKSTIGWSIGNIFLDFTGGTLSMLQMILNAYNYNDWVSIFGDPTKFGLGLFSVIFDVFFIVQHYCLYRGRPAYEEIQGSDSAHPDVIPGDPNLM